MKLSWLIDGEMFPNYLEELFDAITEQGFEAKVIGAPKPPYRWDDLKHTYRDEFPAGSCVVAHGDIELVTRIGQEQIWTPGVFGTVPNYFCSNYYCYFGEYLLNSDYAMLPFGELGRRRDWLLDFFGQEGKVFIRPDSPLKLFAGQMVTTSRFEADLEFMGFYDFPVESLVVVSPPQKITREWRFVVADQQVVAGCLYTADGKNVLEPEYDAQAFELAQQVASQGYEPDPVWIVDICRTKKGAYRLLEIGGFSFANLYACNKADVVAAVSKVAMRLWEQAK
ncbi:ATP-grasp domain-containing protein [Aeoliella mucimassa]|uniref:ATP-grasp domain-containing protein n=1 Tax=Aeoliella mucimassa TaxID=2527972 RepID=A0A518AIR2_9BACT|nr:ATP-grasp domain-containing protein [Aeoliella mucimassa]QDU54554.1 hypothetical protein Pan181_07370 [Aeoliella mucimassa]